MKFLILMVVSLLISRATFAKETRKPASGGMSSGSYQCINSDQERIASFYIRNDGTSAKVEILNARDWTDPRNPVEGCYKVTFRWIKSGKDVENAACCPFGAN